jgi:hypothetical protein
MIRKGTAEDFEEILTIIRFQRPSGRALIPFSPSFPARPPRDKYTPR